VENIYTAYNFSHFAIYLPPKVIKVGGNLTKFWQKQKCTVSLRHGVYYPIISLSVLRLLTDRIAPEHGGCMLEKSSSHFPSQSADNICCKYSQNHWQ